MPDPQVNAYRRENKALRTVLASVIAREQKYVYVHYTLFFLVGFLVGVLWDRSL